MKQLFRRAVSIVCAFTLATSLVPAPALADGGGEEGKAGEGLSKAETTKTLDDLLYAAGVDIAPDFIETTVSFNEMIAPLELETFQMPLREGCHEKWIDRVILPDFVRDAYNVLEEGADGDGVRDYLIEDRYLTGEAPHVSGEEYFPDNDDGITSPFLLFFQAEFNGDNEKKQDYAELMRRYMRIICTAFDRDHPEVFWRSSTLHYEFRTDGKTLFGGLALDAPTRSVLYQDEQTVKDGMANIDKWADRIIQAAPPEEDVEGRVRFFNKWLTENNEYNSTTPLDNIRESYQDAWECISALEGREGDQGPVCEAYARAFKVLCDKSGIPCLLVDGTAITSTGSGEHMWNYVSLGGEWYGVDATWNDPRVIGISGKLSGYEHENYLLVGGSTQISNMAFLESHPVTNASFSGYAFPNGPELSSERYVRDCDKMGHVFGAASRQNETAATCEKNFTYDEVKTCKYCAQTETQTIEEPGTALDHDWGAWTTVRAATCTEPGTEQRVCVRDNSHVETREVAATGHAMGAWTTAQAPTCTESGTEQRVCTHAGCTYAETRQASALGHDWGAWTTVRAATCTEPGTEQRVCVRDGSHVETREIPDTGHAFGAYRYNGDAKAGVDGTETATCATCGASVTRQAVGTALPRVVAPAPAGSSTATVATGLAKGQTATVGGASYTATGAATVTFAGPASKTATSATVPATVTISGRTYQVTAIAPGAFAGNKKLKSVKIGANVTAIPANAFKGCTALASVSFGANVKTIGSKAFYGCKALKSVTLGAKVASIGASAFQNCSKLAKVTVKSKSLKTIGKSAFAGCKALKSVTLSSTKLTTIGASAFSGCAKLKTVSLKTTKLKSVGKNALKGTAKTLSVKVPKNKVKAYQKLFKNKGLKTVRVKK